MENKMNENVMKEIVASVTEKEVIDYVKNSGGLSFIFDLEEISKNIVGDAYAQQIAYTKIAYVCIALDTLKNILTERGVIK